MRSAGHAFVDGHELVALLVVGGVERDGYAEIGPVELAEFAQAVDAADGGDGDLRHGKVHALGLGEDADGLRDVVVVVERLAHAHEHEVLDAVGEVGVVGEAAAFFVVERAGDFHVAVSLAELAGDEALAHDFAGGEILDETHAAGFAECASHAAAHLGGDAERVPVGGAVAGHGDDDGFGFEGCGGEGCGGQGSRRRKRGRGRGRDCGGGCEWGAAAVFDGETEFDGAVVGVIGAAGDGGEGEAFAMAHHGAVFGAEILRMLPAGGGELGHGHGEEGEGFFFGVHQSPLAGVVGTVAGAVAGGGARAWPMALMACSSFCFRRAFCSGVRSDSCR